MFYDGDNGVGVGAVNRQFAGAVFQCTLGPRTGKPTRTRKIRDQQARRRGPLPALWLKGFDKDNTAPVSDWDHGALAALSGGCKAGVILSAGR
jgi:hypothetical protein